MSGRTPDRQPLAARAFRAGGARARRRTGRGGDGARLRREGPGTDSATTLFLNEAFSIRTEHARYLTRNDLCALMAVQYEHAGFAALWPIVECALLSPGREESVDLDGGVHVDYRGGRLSLRGDAASPGYRQAAAVLAAHGLPANAS